MYKIRLVLERYSKAEVGCLRSPMYTHTFRDRQVETFDDVLSFVYKYGLVATSRVVFSRDLTPEISLFAVVTEMKTLPSDALTEEEILEGVAQIYGISEPIFNDKAEEGLCQIIDGWAVEMIYDYHTQQLDPENAELQPVIDALIGG